MSRCLRRGLRTTLTAAAIVSISLPAYAAPSHGRDAANGRIAFSTAWLLPFPDRGTPSQVYTVNPDGSDLKRLTHVPKGKQAGDPDWSPDGGRIVYVSNQDSDYAIWMMNADGSDQHRLYGKPGWDLFTPRWSPDGEQLAAVACDHTLGYELYCDIVLLGDDGRDARVLVGGHRYNGNPDWSPDGDRIAFDSDRKGLVSAVWLVNVDDKRDDQHLTRVTSPRREAFWPQWSPDGGQIVFTSTCCTELTQLFVADADGSNPHRLTGVPDDEFAGLGTYSPDGKQIALLSNHGIDDGALTLFTMNADGTDMTPVVTKHPDMFSPDWGVA